MSNSSAAAHEHHIVPTFRYIQTLVALIVLMVLTVYVAIFVQLPDVGPFTGTVLNQLVALIIAGIKAALVVMIFMGVKWQTPLTKLWAATGFVWFTLMFIIMADYIGRRYEPVPSWRPNLESALPRTLHPGTPMPMENQNQANIHARE